MRLPDNVYVRGDVNIDITEPFDVKIYLTFKGKRGPSAIQIFNLEDHLRVLQCTREQLVLAILEHFAFESYCRAVTLSLDKDLVFVVKKEYGSGVSEQDAKDALNDDLIAIFTEAETKAKVARETGETE